ncbi:site-specific integrase [Clostridium chromiireducens]|uniref:Site-specific integrase n=1 Tax=Clostridium chromiireducens TaxID=225345 RepID=A0A399IK25_9CLOT|nr:tyrosine-type recombinase/integrase [Clostridium chromiireducens]RII32837.1 site-specific integrase [Clostridium chromiireducens]
MNSVEPIRDIQTVYDIEDYLEGENKRNYMLFILGVSTGLRISDILNFRTRDFKDSKGNIREHIILSEKKTGKDKKIKLSRDLRSILKEYLKDKKEYEYIIRSPRGINKPLSRQQAYRILCELGEKFDIRNMACHTLRKTFGYDYYRRTNDIAGLMKIYNHSSPNTTLRYIGITQDVLDSIYDNSNMIRKR